MRKRSHRKPKWVKKLVLYAGYAALAGAMRAFLLLPYRVAGNLGELCGILAYFLARADRARALRNLEQAFPGARTRSERRRVVWNLFRNTGRNAAEAIAATKLSTPDLERQVINFRQARDHLLSIVAEGKGQIIMSGHLGNWELLGSLGARYTPTNVVANRLHFEPFNQLAERFRRAARMNTIYLGESPREVLRALKKGEIVAILPDQDIRRLPGTFVEFFGTPAWTPIGPVLVARLSGSPMVPWFLVRRGRRYFVEFGDRIPQASTGDANRDIDENTRRWTEVYEGCIRRYPDQWAWTHPRWKTRPSDLPPAFLRRATLPSDPRRRREPPGGAGDVERGEGRPRDGAGALTS
jgi:KDO2-lipid IV(A) lauroyltransferase